MSAVPVFILICFWHILFPKMNEIGEINKTLTEACILNSLGSCNNMPACAVENVSSLNNNVQFSR
jgi:hypothetical protein